jgi:hypothetical protein
VKRNRSRFPADFMFQLTTEEIQSLRSQIATSKSGRGGRRFSPNRASPCCPRYSTVNGRFR